MKMIINQEKKLSKNGNILIITLYFTFIIFVIVFAMILILNIQLNTQLLILKEELYYIVNNDIIINYYEELSYYNMNFNYEQLKSCLNDSLKKRYNFAEITNIFYEEEKQSFILNLNVILKPVVFKNIINSYTMEIEEEIRFKALEAE